MTEISIGELRDHLGKPILMKTDSSPKLCEVVVKKVAGEIIYGFNKTRNAVFEITNPKPVKFYKVDVE